MNAAEFDYGYTSARPSSPDYLLPALRRWLPPRPSLNILDLGCGNGSLAGLLESQGHTVTGVEQAKSGIALARKHFPAVRFIEASIHDLPYAELGRAFDVVISVEVVEHLLYPMDLMRAARRCVKSGGHLILTTPYHGYLKNVAIAMSGKFDRHFSPLWDGGHVKFFSVNTLSKLVRDGGFTDLQFQFAGRAPLLWKSMLCRALAGAS